MSPHVEDEKVEKLLTMSTREMSRLEVMNRLCEKRLKQKEAAEILGVSIRQIKRLLSKYRANGASGLVSKRRGKASNNQLSAEMKQKVLDLLKVKYAGFGPTLACEKLVEEEGLKISDESVRQIMIGEKLWKARRERKETAHQMRERRACFGELVQIDGSPHAWFEERGATCTLLVAIDDATGKLVGLLFAEQESFHSYASLVKAYFERYGKPAAFYSDKHGIFRVNQPTTGVGEVVTQFGRAMQELDIQILCANTPQAKGRVERANQTLQDRLVKEMRLRGISSLEQGNAYLPEFIEDFNQRFCVLPRSTHDVHRPLTPLENLPHILTWQEPRAVSKNLTIQFKKVVYQIKTDRPSYALRNARVTVCEDAAGQVAILYKSKPLEFTVFQKQQHQAEIVDTKDIDRVLDNQRFAHTPAPNHPWRHSPVGKAIDAYPLPILISQKGCG
jgi:transposase